MNLQPPINLGNDDDDDDNGFPQKSSNFHNANDPSSSPSSYCSSNSFANPDPRPTSAVDDFIHDDLHGWSPVSSSDGFDTTTMATPKRETSFVNNDNSPLHIQSKSKKLVASKRSSRSRSVDLETGSTNSDSNVRSTSITATKKRKSRFSSKQFKIFRNLLLLEQNLRMQYAEQQSLRTKFLLFYFTMIVSSMMIFLKLYFTSSSSTTSNNESEIIAFEDKNSSWNLFLKFFLVFQVITLTLFHISGEYKRTIVMPRRFLYLTNKSLRQLNLRLIRLPKSLIDQFLDICKFFLKVIVWLSISFIEDFMPLKKVLINRNLCYVRDFLQFLKILKLRLVLIHLSSNYDQINLNSTFNIKLSLNSRVFTPNIRESWELFRNEFWLREFNRRTKLIYSINYDTDIVAIEEMVLRNEVVNKKTGNSVSKIGTPRLGSHSMSPTRTPRSKSKKLHMSASPGLNSLPTPRSQTYTPLTTQMLKSFEAQQQQPEPNDSKVTTSPVLSSNSAIMNKTELLKKDRDDRRVRRKSQINLSIPELNLSKPIDYDSSEVLDEFIQDDEERMNTFDGEDINRLQEKLQKRTPSSANRRRYS
ncbi:Nem1-Spo7 phosphatase regulatory subunit [Saccharomycopsis crataegensis]|uniref:Nem1-Spo7 phosphatase regulatory subunit n=1 Tax=Saccharomycopsis crataegensis TaxID=43959 RepID=A0AAV5QY19_9ASCO|nr:Nem1-Spo7 phosphatase regulatory subunit [Saccharomycopsis crataegensis]